jgi:ATP-dependent DNA helicase RecG
VTAARLRARGVETVRDLLLRLPRRYDDLRRATPIAALEAMPDGAVVLVRGAVRRVQVFPRRFLFVTVEQDGASVRAEWFRARGAMAKSFAKGTEVALAGPLRTAADGTRCLLHPTNVTVALAARSSAGLGLRPRYPTFEGVGARLFERLVATALERFGPDMPELLTASARARLRLPSLAQALRAVHAPPDELDAGAVVALESGRTAAHRRLALEELLVVQAAFLLRRAEARAVPAPVTDVDAEALLARLQGAFGFTLTGSQVGAVRDIAADMRAPAPMQRLLLGDVGSGKTAVALAAAALTAAAGGQTLMMVPTEALAEQHGRTLGPLARRLDIAAAVLTGATPALARRAIHEECAAGRLGLLIGTHALLDAGLRPADLRLCIVDEQHRFGVAQRAGLGGGADRRPHLLALSATPIPRTLALALHGDLDVSVLTERPSGRRAPATVLCAVDERRLQATRALRAAVAEGHQAFVVCPVRERARRAGTVTAVARFATLRRELRPARVGLVHGAMSAEDKGATLRAFAAHEIDVLVATTVVELGIDVPNATVMLVEDADRFGLAQLHQIRGRVGRGDAPGTCFLVPSSDAAEDSDAMARLRDLAATDDGFRLAELDLARRGHGDLYGTRQAGVPALASGDLGELFALVEIARRAAEEAFAGDPALEHPEHAALACAARARAAAQALFAEEAG